jgi:hypothetical protein
MVSCPSGQFTVTAVGVVIISAVKVKRDIAGTNIVSKIGTDKSGSQGHPKMERASKVAEKYQKNQKKKYY